MAYLPFENTKIPAPSQAFAGHALLVGPDKKPITLAETLTAAIESGEVHSGKVLLLEENRGGR